MAITRRFSAAAAGPDKGGAPGALHRQYPPEAETERNLSMEDNKHLNQTDGAPEELPFDEADA